MLEEGAEVASQDWPTPLHLAQLQEPSRDAWTGFAKISGGAWSVLQLELTEHHEVCRPVDPFETPNQSISAFRLRWTIMSWTEAIVFFNRSVSVALV